MPSGGLPIPSGGISGRFSAEETDWKTENIRLQTSSIANSFFMLVFPFSESTPGIIAWIFFNFMAYL